MKALPTRFRSLLAAALLAGGLAAAHQAQATTLFTLNNVKDAKGGTYTGSFEFNAANDTFSSVAITLTSSFLPDGSVSFTDPSTASFCTLCSPTGQYDEFSFGPRTASSGFYYTLFFDIANPLSLDGANFLVPDKHHSNDFSDLDFQSHDGKQKYVGIKHGSLDASTVPEPASFALFGLGLLGLAFAASRRSRRNDSLS